MTVVNYYLLVFVHNLLMAFFVILNAVNQSFPNQIFISILALTYWITGSIILYRKKASIR